VLSCESPQGIEEQLFLRWVELVLCQTLIITSVSDCQGWSIEGFELTWSRISIHNNASADSKSKMNFRPSFDDKISARVRTDSASFVALRVFFHSLSKFAAIAFVGRGDKEKVVGGGWGEGASRPSHEATRSLQSHRELKACTSGVAVRCPSGPARG